MADTGPLLGESTQLFPGSLGRGGVCPSPGKLTAPDAWSPLSQRALGTWEGALAGAAPPSWLSGSLAPPPFRTWVIFLTGGNYLRCHLVPEFRSLGRGTSVLQLEDSQQSCLPRPGGCAFAPAAPLVLFLRTGTYL